MASVLIHATVSLDGCMADARGGIDWMLGFDVADDDLALVRRIQGEIGAVVGGARRSGEVVEGEEPYGGALGVPVFLLSHEPREPVVRGGTTCAFVVEDVAQAVAEARAAAGDRTVAVLGGSIGRQCLALGLVDEIQLHVLPILLGEGVSLFGGLERPIRLERVETAGFASEAHLRYRVVPERGASTSSPS